MTITENHYPKNMYDFPSPQPLLPDLPLGTIYPRYAKKDFAREDFQGWLLAKYIEKRGFYIEATHNKKYFFNDIKTLGRSWKLSAEDLSKHGNTLKSTNGGGKGSGYAKCRANLFYKHNDYSRFIKEFLGFYPTGGALKRFNMPIFKRPGLSPLGSAVGKYENDVLSGPDYSNLHQLVKYGIIEIFAEQVRGNFVRKTYKLIRKFDSLLHSFLLKASSTRTRPGRLTKRYGKLIKFLNENRFLSNQVGGLRLLNSHNELCFFYNGIGSPIPSSGGKIIAGNITWDEFVVVLKKTKMVRKSHDKWIVSQTGVNSEVFVKEIERILTNKGIKPWSSSTLSDAVALISQHDNIYNELGNSQHYALCEIFNIPEVSNFLSKHINMNIKNFEVDTREIQFPFSFVGSGDIKGKVEISSKEKDLRMITKGSSLRYGSEFQYQIIELMVAPEDLRIFGWVEKELKVTGDLPEPIIFVLYVERPTNFSQDMANQISILNRLRKSLRIAESSNETTLDLINNVLSLKATQNWPEAKRILLKWRQQGRKFNMLEDIRKEMLRVIMSIK